MSKNCANPFFESDLSKYFDFSKWGVEARLPEVDLEVLAAFQKKNIEAYTALTQAAFESMQAMWRRQSDLFRQMMEETAETLQTVAACSSTEEKLVKHAEVSKAALDKYIASARDVAETFSKCNTQTLDTVSARVTEGMNEFRNVVKINRAA